MQLSKYDFYILVEGHPKSPELAFFTQAIQKIVDLNRLSSFFIEALKGRNILA